jgi:hypothetical protein
VVQGTALCHHEITDAVLPYAAPALPPPVDLREPAPGPCLVGPGRLPCPCLAAWVLGRYAALPVGERAGHAAPILPPSTPGRAGRRRRGGHARLLPAASVRRPPPEACAQGLDQQALGAGGVLGLAARPCGLGRRGVGADASETPRRGARGGREPAGAAPRGRRAGTSPWLPCLAGRWPRPPKRPGPTWRVEVWREVSRQSRRSAGVGRGPGWDTGHRRAVRGDPARRPATLGAWHAASKGGTRACNASRVTLGPSRNSLGLDCRAGHRQLAMRGASWHQRHRRP